MNNHIDDLIAQMKKQFLHMREFYANQLKEIEDEFERERDALLKQNDIEIQALFKKHQETEDDFLKQKQQIEQSNASELETQKSQDANN
jgi:succinate dehydrogenase flavin-adding protein (antitoxin of CptAB toxin-antitoxin module)